MNEHDLGFEWFDVDVHIRLVNGGETRVYRTQEKIHPSTDSDKPEWSPFIWKDGNFSCDCNRGIFFAEAAGEPDRDHPCGDGMYLVRIIRVSDNLIIYDELGQPTKN